MAEWIETRKRRPKLTAKQRAEGRPVLIWPHHADYGISATPFAYFGTRYGNGKNPVFYIYGREIWPTHWMELPSGPVGVPAHVTAQQVKP